MNPAAIFLILAATGVCSAQSFRPDVPHIWNDTEIANLEIPVVNPQYSPRHVPAEYYYRMPVRAIYKSYRVYAPGRAPDGYLEQLKQKEPEIVFDAVKLRSREDWIRAGEAVFDAPTAYNEPWKMADVADPGWLSAVKPTVAPDGSLPWFRYVVREKGKVDLGTLSCAMCRLAIMVTNSSLSAKC